MAIPTYDSIIFPLLQALGRHQEPIRALEARRLVAKALAVGEADLAEMLPSGQQSVFDNRVGWAHDRLKRAGLSDSVKRGYWMLSKEGRAYLAVHPKGLSESELVNLARVSVGSRASGSAVEQGSGDEGQSGAVLQVAAQRVSPQERLEAAHLEMVDQLASDLLDQVRRVDPGFFERLVLDLLHSMGYGVARGDLKQVGQSGDGGIDGIVNLDKLGLQKVYVQAKRWQDGNVVGRSEVQAFYGALAERRATYGVFITASSFSAPAQVAARSLSDTIILIDGSRLVRLMMDHEVGVSTVHTYKVKRLDSDYFADE